MSLVISIQKYDWRTTINSFILRFKVIFICNKSWRGIAIIILGIGNKISSLILCQSLTLNLSGINLEMIVICFRKFWFFFDWAELLIVTLIYIFWTIMFITAIWKGTTYVVHAKWGVNTVIFIPILSCFI